MALYDLLPHKQGPRACPNGAGHSRRILVANRAFERPLTPEDPAQASKGRRSRDVSTQHETSAGQKNEMPQVWNCRLAEESCVISRPCSTTPEQMRARISFTVVPVASRNVSSTAKSHGSRFKATAYCRASVRIASTQSIGRLDFVPRVRSAPAITAAFQSCARHRLRVCQAGQPHTRCPHIVQQYERADSSIPTGAPKKL